MLAKMLALLAIVCTSCGAASAADYHLVRVKLVPMGPRQTEVIVLAPHSVSSSKLTLVSGSDCATRGVTRIGLSGLARGRSQTLVAIPVGAFRRGRFMIEMRDSTSRARIAETCERI